MTLRQWALLVPLFVGLGLFGWICWLGYKYTKEQELAKDLEDLVRMTDKAVGTSQGDGLSEQVRGPLR